MLGSEEDLKSLLMKVKEESEKTGLKLNNKKAMIHSTKFCLVLIDIKNRPMDTGRGKERVRCMDRVSFTICKIHSQ